MRYESTRGIVNGKTFQDVMLSGYAADGGMFLPEYIPKLTTEELHRFSALTFVGLCKEVIQKFTSSEEYISLNLDALIEKAFSTFDCKEVIPVKSIGSFHIAELWHGRSLAFKDLSVSCLSFFVEEYCRINDHHINLTCATSGDTGSAIMEHVKGSEFIDVFTLYPEGRCHHIQELQMICIGDSNVHTFCAEGTSDDFDIIFEKIYKDSDFVREHNLASFNSVNWLRIMIQMAHYIYLYLNVVEKIQEFVTIVVPSGGLGNLTAGYICHLMGLPIKLVAAVNQNDTTHQILTTGKFVFHNEVLKSSSCSMDIMIPYNFERLLYLASNRDDTTARVMQEFTANKATTIPDDVIKKLRETIQSASVSESDVKETIKKVWSDYEYHVEPHTAVATSIVLCPEKYGVDFAGTKIGVLSCASPQKFPGVFQELGIPLDQTDSVKELLSKEKHFSRLRKGEDWVSAVKSRIVEATKKFRERKKPSTSS